jgi:hypothetical protein
VADASEKPKLSRLTRVDLDFAYRTRGERAMMRIAYYGRAVARVAVRTGSLCLGVALVAGMIFPRLGFVAGILGLMGVSSFLASGLARVTALFAAAPARTARALRLQLWSRDDSGAGTRTVVRGRVAALRTVKTLDGRPAVFVHRRATRRGRGAETNQAEDFLVDDGSGALTRVAVEHALFLDRPTPVFGSWMGVPLEVFPFLPRLAMPTQIEEAVIFPGDHVEIVGRAETVVDPSVSDRLGRQTPLIRVIGGTADEPVLLRTVS